jgi:hypothetical protein
MAEPSKTLLSREHIRKALAVLQEEQQAHPISSVQRKLFFWYEISVVVFLVSFWLWSLIYFINLFAVSFELPINIILAVIPGVSIIPMFLLFFANMKLIWQTWREFRLALKTKLWQLVARTRTGRRWPLRPGIAFGAVFLVLTFLALWAAPAADLMEFIELLLVFFISLAYSFLLASPFLFLRFARRRLDVLRNSDQLVAFLTKGYASESPAGTDQVSIPTDVFKEMGDIEDVHIQRSRATAIAEFRDRGQAYAVLKSRAMAADIAKLDEGTQLRVEACIAELASQFPPPDALHESGGVWRVLVTETPYELVCRQDEAARRIELLSLEQGDDKSSTRRTAEAPHG